jgi:hypothetical protein
MNPFCLLSAAVEAKLRVGWWWETAHSPLLRTGSLSDVLLRLAQLVLQCMLYCLAIVLL